MELYSMYFVKTFLKFIELAKAKETIQESNVDL